MRAGAAVVLLMVLASLYAPHAAAQFPNPCSVLACTPSPTPPPGNETPTGGGGIPFPPWAVAGFAGIVLLYIALWVADKFSFVTMFKAWVRHRYEHHDWKAKPPTKPLQAVKRRKGKEPEMSWGDNIVKAERGESVQHPHKPPPRSGQP